MNLPNALTILRIFFVPLLVAALVQESAVYQIGSLRITNDWLSLAIFLVAIWVFLQAKLSNPGLWHVITAGGLIVLFATRGLTRIAYLAVSILMIAAQQVMTHIVVKGDDYAHLDPVNKGFAWAFVAMILGFAVVQAVASGRSQEAGPFVKGMAFAAILVWVMTAAAGRWLAFA